MKKIPFPIAIIVIVICAVAVGGIATWQYGLIPGIGPAFTQTENETTNKEQTCISTGGMVEIAMCCKSINNFPNTCFIGACGCSLDNSQNIKICDCGEKRCFNGKECISTITEKFPQKWYYEPSEAPEGYLVFQEDGVLKIPEWITGKIEKTQLNWFYNKEKEILTINFQSIPDLFPENEELAKNLFSVEGYSLTGSFAGYDKENLNIEIYVNSETKALNFFGWIFYKI